MNAGNTLTKSDEGKKVVNANGNAIGSIIEVKDGVGYVDPDPELSDSIKANLGWGDKQLENTFRLDSSNIDTISGDEVRLDL